MHQLGSKYYVSRPLPLTLGVKRSEQWHVAYPIKGNHVRQHGRKYCACSPSTPLTQGLGSKGQNSTFSDHGHVACQIKGNHETQQHSSKYFARRPLPPHPAMTLGDVVKRLKFNFFRTWLCCISNLRESRTTLYI